MGVEVEQVFLEYLDVRHKYQEKRLGTTYKIKP